MTITQGRAGASDRRESFRVTAKLSKAFYDKFGEEATNELVNWLNAVDETYRTNLRELNELNFARFDAKLEQRLAELRAEMKARFAQFDAKLERGLAELRTEMNARFAQSEVKLEERLAKLNDKFAERLRSAEIRLAGLTLAWVPLALAIFEFVFRR